MNKALLYILYATMCIVLFIISLIFLWWFTAKPIESFVAPMPFLVFVGITSTGAVHYADVDVPMNPKWISTGLTAGDIAGTYGKLYTVSNGGSVPKYGAYDSATQTAMTGGTVTQVATDDANMVGGVNGTSVMYSTNLTGTMSQVGTQKQVAFSNMAAYALGVDGALYYTSTPTAGGWVKTSPAGTTFKQVTFDIQVCALDTAGNVWCADTNVGNASANWAKQGTQQFNNITLKDGRLVGVGTDGKVYYSDSYSEPSWRQLSTQVYNSTGGATGSPVTFSKVIMMFPGLDSRRRRFLGSGSCNSNEEKIGNYCYQPCPIGKANGTLCPYKVKFMPAVATCATGEFINDACFQPCPQGTTASVDTCISASTPKATKPVATASSEPKYMTPSYSCSSDGSVSGRYVRVRPTSLIENNKLCIQKLVVKDAAGNILTGTASATDGTCADAPIGGTSCPGGFVTYLSGSKWDNETDGGAKSRAGSLYWDLDLGSVKNIKTISFTGCNYIARGGKADAVSPVSTANADQITGMIIEVLFKSNEPSTAPVASRSLGPSKGSPQVITFNYTIKDPIIPGRCFDSCPPINGVKSIDGGDHSCIAASGGITNRSVTVPLELPDPVCEAAVNASGNAISVPAVDRNGKSLSISNWRPDPANPGYILSCDNLPGSTLVPVSTTLNLPRATGFNIAGEIVNENYTSWIYGIKFVTISSFPWFNIEKYRIPSHKAVFPVNGTTNIDTNNAFGPIKTGTSEDLQTITTNWIKSDGVTKFTNTDTPYVCVNLSSTKLCPKRNTNAGRLLNSTDEMQIRLIDISNKCNYKSSTSKQ